jgi:hypothetical protein
MPSHRIRLRGPWRFEWTSAKESQVRKIHLPADWDDLLATGSGRLRLARTFHKPTNLGLKDEVDLVFEEWPGSWAVSLNAHPIRQIHDSSAGSPARITVTALLLATNEISAETQIEPAAISKTGRGPVGNLVLEIRSA